MLQDVWLDEQFPEWRDEQEVAHEASACECRERYFILNNGTPAAEFQTEVEWHGLCPLHGDLVG